MEKSTSNKLIEYGGFKVAIKDLGHFFSLLYQNPTFGHKEIGQETGLGKPKIENFIYYLRDFDLLTKGSYKSTELSHILFKNDRKFREIFTSWILLYKWSRKEGNSYLYYLLNFEENGKSKDEMEKRYKIWAEDNGFKTEYKDIIKGLIARTVNAFTDPDAFQNLNLINIFQEKVYRGEPYNVHPLLLGYILYDNRNGRMSITINELMQEPNNIGKFFAYNTRSLENQLIALQNLNLIKRVQAANLNMIEFLYDGSALSLIEKYYEENL